MPQSTHVYQFDDIRLANEAYNDIANRIGKDLLNLNVENRRLVISGDQNLVDKASEIAKGHSGKLVHSANF
jgi:hypothetical protein